MSRPLATIGFGAALALGPAACVLDDRDHAGHCPTRELPGDFDGEDLELLRGYTHVGGDLVVPEDSEDLSALGCLEEVGGAMVIDGGLVTDGVAAIEDLDDLAALRHVGGLSLDHLPRLHSTAGLAALESIGNGGLHLSDLVALHEIAAPAGLTELGGVHVLGWPGLASWPSPLGPARIEEVAVEGISPSAEIGAFATVESAHKIDVRVTEAPAESSGSAVSFAALVSVDSLTLGGVGSATIASFTSLHDVGWLRLEDVTGTDLTGLESLVVAERLSIFGGDALVSLRGLDGLATLSSLELGSMPLLHDLDGLAALRELPLLPRDRLDIGPVSPSVQIQGCPALVDVGGLSGVQSEALSSLLLADLPALTSAPAWPNLRRLGVLSIEATGVADLDVFAGVTDLAQILYDSETMMPYPPSTFAITLAHNPALVDLDGLAGVMTVGHRGDILVQDNPALPTCAVDEMIGTMNALGRTDGQLEVSGNDDAAGC